MGCQQGKGTHAMSLEQQHAAFDLAMLADEIRDEWLQMYRPDALADYTILALTGKRPAMDDMAGRLPVRARIV